MKQNPPHPLPKKIYIYIYNLEETDENSVYYVHKIHHVNLLKTEMKVNNQNINFEVDTAWV